MGSQVNLIVAKICMENFKEKALRTVDSPHRLWKGLGTTPFIAQYTEHKDTYEERVSDVGYLIYICIDNSTPATRGSNLSLL